MNKLILLSKVLFRIVQYFLLTCILLTIVSFEITIPEYNWIYYFLHFGKGIIASYITVMIGIEFNEFYKNIYETK